MNKLTPDEEDFTEKLHYNDFFEMLPDGVIVVDQRGKIQFMNSKSSQIFGYDCDELLQNNIEILLPESYRRKHIKHRKDYVQNPSKILMGERKVLNGKKKDGEEIQIEISLGPVKILKENYVVAIIRDASLRNRMEKLESMNEELEHFAYFVAHDLQEPLRTMTSFVNLINLENSDQLNDSSLDYLLHISDACHRMSGIIRGLLNFSSVGEKSEHTTLNCNIILKHIVKDLHSRIVENKCVIEYDTLPVIKGDETGITLLFQNLITNAIKFRSEDKNPVIKISAKKEKGGWHFSVQDNGIGIDNEHQEKIFKIFQRLHSKSEYEGTGIGLAHCKKIVESHGGKIWVESNNGEGSTFHFTIANN